MQLAHYPHDQMSYRQRPRELLREEAPCTSPRRQMDSRALRARPPTPLLWSKGHRATPRQTPLRWAGSEAARRHQKRRWGKRYEVEVPRSISQVETPLQPRPLLLRPCFAPYGGDLFHPRRCRSRQELMAPSPRDSRHRRLQRRQARLHWAHDPRRLCRRHRWRRHRLTLSEGLGAPWAGVCRYARHRAETHTVQVVNFRAAKGLRLSS